jgi:ABC-2 type transport system permease protein
MSAFLSALWAEALKARRSTVLWITAAAVTLLPLVDGLFMIILKNPGKAREMGLLGAKAQLAAGAADGPTFYYVLTMGIAAAGAILFAFITAWVFGREFSDHTVKELLALPTPRWVIVCTKFLLIGVWVMALSLWIFAVGWGIGNSVGIPGITAELETASFLYVMEAAFFTLLLMPLVAFFASVGRGYLPPLGWAIFTLVLAQLAQTLGRADWFPWAVPLLIAVKSGPNGSVVELHSYWLVLIASIAGIAATILWWRSADQTK